MEFIKTCTICNCTLSEYSDYKVENTKGELVDVCFECYCQCNTCNASGVKITPAQLRKSIEQYGEPLAYSYITTHSKDFAKDFLTNKTFRKEFLTKENCVYFDEETQKIKVKKAFVCKNDFNCIDTYRCQYCGEKYYYNFKKDNANTIKDYIVKKLLNNVYCCKECKKSKNFAKDFLSGCYCECGVFEGKNIRKDTLKMFKEGGFFTSVRGYHNAPPVIPITKAKKFNNFAGFGFELETENKNYNSYYNDDDDYDDDYDDSDYNNNLCIELNNNFENTFYYNTDGSLNNTGIEIITRPADYEFWQNFNFEKFSDILHKNNRVSGAKENASDCGMHIHVSREMFGKNNEEQIFNTAKILLFFKKYEIELERFGGRDFENHYCKSYYLDSNIDALKIAIKNRDNERYRTINLRNEKTIEFRFFDGTTDAIKIKTNIEFLYLLINGVKKYKSIHKFLNCKLLFNNASEELKNRLREASLLCV